ncbi:hypothetical protein A3I99_03585 [Candidatus Kaiserbacteria bacterium RIFCSPLOWO2_02_FULL_45_11b]|uniref:YHYH domain-containing protein n=1 Tax=Candidatus Kaiserbacteria bacterium RIFCSPLOWO2_12_FULL_45_26 TaxID=1798525 RepID=A0A1F6FH38_9BACT|nr:MAG: hypothetical protein A2929_02540 [Candidatus Kaiserbacteria bacterium RIFCSPLOWO2_01_FULL_45_25]OGG83674.1 MAG: hypothetical protein A3I99_03585 [Candidatus Kaiserbacteria bacterium RIFCSPLOWO2_02_FULL_45_11b]OGG85166.1 MAG: hypothetical protein A3G90_03870 [Candidatus Kaiserbacteria bacterium RIFCSPLOWO2_12_FULL_45_26]
MNIKYLLLAAVLLFTPMMTFAHPGGLDSSGGHNCWTNCSSWGEVYGQWHSHGGSSYSTYTTPTYTPTYSTFKSNSDCPSYGFAYLGSCYELPSNAKKSAFSGFTCNYGYDEVGFGLSKKCLPEVDNGTRIGSSIFCDYGYELYYSSCIKKSSSGYSYTSGYPVSDYDLSSLYSCPKNSSEDEVDSTKCTCNIGYEVNKDKDGCKKTSKKTNDKICRASFGKYSLWTGKYDEEDAVPTCKCKKNYEWSEAGTSCVKES